MKNFLKWVLLLFTLQDIRQSCVLANENEEIYSPIFSPKITYAYQWKVRDKPIYKGNSVKALIKLCPKGCGAGCSIPKCDNGSIQAVRIAQHQAKGYQKFSQDIFVPMIVRLVFVIVIIIGNIYLFIRGHFRLQDLWYRTAENQWQVEEDPTSGLEPHIWANMKVTVEKRKERDRDADTKKKGGHIPNPISRGTVFWRFQKIMSLYYGRERYYRMARAFNPLKWQIQNMGNLDILEQMNEETVKPADEETEKQPENKEKGTEEGNYNWKADLFRGDFSHLLLGKVFGDEAAYNLTQLQDGIPIPPPPPVEPPKPPVQSSQRTMRTARQARKAPKKNVKK